MAASKVKILGIDFTFVWKYRYSKNKDDWEKHIQWREWKLGFFFKKDKYVGKKNFGNHKKWKDNYVTGYMLGIELLIFKGWMEFSKGIMIMEIKDEIK